MTIEELKMAVYNTADVETCSLSVKNIWKKDNPLIGHCAIAALLVNNYFGYEIRKSYIPQMKIYHYYNYNNGDIIDITRDQFEESVTFINEEIRTKEHLLEDIDTKNRYENLKKRVEKYLNENNRI